MISCWQSSPSVGVLALLWVSLCSAHNFYNNGIKSCCCRIISSILYFLETALKSPFTLHIFYDMSVGCMCKVHSSYNISVNDQMKFIWLVWTANKFFFIVSLLTAPKDITNSPQYLSAGKCPKRKDLKSRRKEPSSRSSFPVSTLQHYLL